MNKTEYLLICLAEECAEVQHAITKSLKFGLDNWHPTHGTFNRELVAKELEDLLAVMVMLQEEGCVRELTQSAMAGKTQRVKEYMNCSRESGVLAE